MLLMNESDGLTFSVHLFFLVLKGQLKKSKLNTYFKRIKTLLLMYLCIYVTKRLGKTVWSDV